MCPRKKNKQFNFASTCALCWHPWSGMQLVRCMFFVPLWYTRENANISVEQKKWTQNFLFLLQQEKKKISLIREHTFLYFVTFSTLDFFYRRIYVFATNEFQENGASKHSKKTRESQLPFYLSMGLLLIQRKNNKMEIKHISQKCIT